LVVFGGACFIQSKHVSRLIIPVCHPPGQDP
jgi:hypothetical protein